MTHQPNTKARIQYSSRDELDIAVICYCRGRSRYDLHARTRLALNSFYGPFAMEELAPKSDVVRQQALCSIRHLNNQIQSIQETFLSEWVAREPFTQTQGPQLVEEHRDRQQDIRLVPKPVVETSPNRDLASFLGEEAALMAEINPFNNDLM